METGQRARLLALAGALVLLILAIAPLGQHTQLIAAMHWIDGLGVWGPIALIAIYVVACVILVPGLILSLGAGFCFGLLIGTIVVSAGSTIGACAAFLIGRAIARRWVEGKLAERASLAVIDESVGREGFKIVFLLRLSPVFPFVVLNYVLALTRISFGRYALASWIGMLPLTIMYVYVGSAARSLSDISAGDVASDPWHGPLLWCGLVATMIATFVLTRIARRSLTAVIPSE